MKPLGCMQILAVANSLNGKSVAVAVASVSEGRMYVGEIEDCDAGYSNLLLAIQHISSPSARSGSRGTSNAGPRAGLRAPFPAGAFHTSSGPRPMRRGRAGIASVRLPLR